MGVFLLLIAVDPVVIQEINAYAGVRMKDISIIQDYSHMYNLALFVVKKGKITFFNFSHEVDGVAQFSLLLTVAGNILPHNPAEKLHQSGAVKTES